MSGKKSKKPLSNQTLSTFSPEMKMTFSSHNLSIHPTSSFDMSSFEDSISIFNGSKEGYIYSRYNNPTVQSVSDKISLLESGSVKNNLKTILTSSGMSAIATVLLAVMPSGSTLVTNNGLYGGTTELLEHLAKLASFRLIYANLNDLDSLAQIQKNQPITAIYIETPSNPLLECIALKPIAEFAKNNGIKTICDNSISTAFLQRPISLGMDFVVYSTTKFLSGHGNTISGCIIYKQKAVLDRLLNKTLQIYGTNCSPFEAWMVDTGLKTLALRMERQCANARLVATFLNTHKKVKKVYHTSLSEHPSHKIALEQMTDHSPLMSFEVKGGFNSATKVMNGYKLIKHAPTLGDLNTLSLHPDTSSHRNVPADVKKKIGITPGLIRLSVGIESADDILSELDEILAKI